MWLHGQPLHQFPISAGTVSAQSPQFPLLLIERPLFNSLSSNSQNPNCFRPRSVSPRWDYGSGNSDKAESFSGFNFEEDDGGNKHDGFGFQSSNRKRVWWSDDNEDEDEDEGSFGVLEDSFDASWILKVLNAFGWMVPAVAISMLLGTGSNTFLMALVLPIAQSVISLVTDAFWGSSVNAAPKPNRQKRSKRKKPFRRARNGTEMKQDVFTEEGSENFSFQGATDEISSKTRKSRLSGFGGWDELDQGLGSYKDPARGPAGKGNEPRTEKKGKLSTRARNRDRPLLVRLLIAVFPFLGSWTRLLF